MNEGSQTANSGKRGIGKAKVLVRQMSGYTCQLNRTATPPQ
jgi:hypothetical protein